MLKDYAQEMRRRQVFHKIEVERARQDRLHPEFPILQVERLAILLEEAGEVAKAINEKKPEEIEAELVQVAAVAMRWLEQIKSPGH